MNEMKLMNERNQYLIKFIEYKNIFFRIKVTKKRNKERIEENNSVKINGHFCGYKNEMNEEKGTTEETG